MAFNPSTTVASSTTAAKGEYKKADFFINFNKTDDEGKSHKVGFLALHKDNALHAWIIEQMQASESGLTDVLSSFTVDFKSSVPAVSKATFSFKKA